MLEGIRHSAATGLRETNGEIKTEVTEGEM